METNKATDDTLLSHKDVEKGEADHGKVVPLNCVHTCLDFIEDKLKRWLQENKATTKKLMQIILTSGILAYVIAACVINFERARVLLYLTVITLVCMTYGMIKSLLGEWIHTKIIQP